MQYPNRPSNKITQSFNSGVVRFCGVKNKARAGYAPRQCLYLKFLLRFDEQRMGILRYYQSLQNQIRIDRVIRVPKACITNQDMAIIDSIKYRIDMVQTVKDIYPDCMDVTLIRIDQEDDYEIL